MEQRTVVRDRFGAPVYPQPVADGRDPMMWSMAVKLRVLVVVSLLAFVSLFTAFSISPAIFHVAKYLDVPVVRGLYIVGIYLLFVGIGPFFFNPLAHVYGRRPVFIAGLVGFILSAIATGLARSYPVMLVFRALNGFFAGIPVGLGVVVCCDMFYLHERGLYMGIWVLFHLTGGHLGPVVGGYIYKGLNWHWCLFMPAIAAGLLLVLFYFAVPETLYQRAVEAHVREGMSLYQLELLEKQRRDSRALRIGNFLRPLRMLRYPNVLIPCIYYAVASGYGNMIFVDTSAILFRFAYHFKTWQVGLLLGLPLTIGSFIGEFGAGGFSDWVARRRASRRGGARVPEDRLWAMLPGVLLCPLGLIVEGYCIKHKIHWAAAGVGICIASMGLQIITTVTYTYVTECFYRQAAEVSTLLNFCRQIFCFCVAFYAMGFAWRFDVPIAWGTLAGVQLIVFIPVALLMRKGAQWRDMFGEPGWNLDL
ncbi:MFS general substrate transporter [Trichodelitschia bisporula]|uniref:MFS general substrate transporter n=1 Tax=Trichodelitschia bisporula TaxID=703511 RepID=A0A6G1HX96_9PEZI|nr:MFS general substrate transporter [Trichodelitschia bisporula]